jgi:hypothetical protein
VPGEYSLPSLLKFGTFHDPAPGRDPDAFVDGGLLFEGELLDKDSQRRDWLQPRIRAVSLGARPIHGCASRSVGSAVGALCPNRCSSGGRSGDPGEQVGRSPAPRPSLATQQRCRSRGPPPRSCRYRGCSNPRPCAQGTERTPATVPESDEPPNSGVKRRFRLYRARPPDGFRHGRAGEALRRARWGFRCRRRRYTVRTGREQRRELRENRMVSWT